MSRNKRTRPVDDPWSVAIVIVMMILMILLCWIVDVRPSDERWNYTGQYNLYIVQPIEKKAGKRG